MNTPIAIATPLLVALLWLLTRRRPQVPGQASRLTGVAPTALVQPAAQAPAPAAAPSPMARVAGRRQRLAAAHAALSAEPEQRQAAMQQLGQWGDRAALPLLQRGLRDPHPQVVLAAAGAMERFRGRSAAGSAGGSGLSASVSVQRLPRNAKPRA